MVISSLNVISEVEEVDEDTVILRFLYDYTIITIALKNLEKDFIYFNEQQIMSLITYDKRHKMKYLSHGISHKPALHCWRSH